MKNDALIKNDRREFIIKTFSSCAFCFFASSNLFGSDNKLHSVTSDEQHKYLLNAGMSLQDVFDFAFKEWYIPAMKNLMEQIGKEKFLDMLRTSSEMLYKNDKNSNVNYNERTLTAWSNGVKEACKNWGDRLTYEILNDNENVLEMKFTECLWAKTFRESDASEIGYAGCCYQDYPNTKAFNPNFKMVREKTLMQGHDCCQVKWFMET
jgi:hypothetical protein